jgi:antirestriction protein
MLHGSLKKGDKTTNQNQNTGTKMKTELNPRLYIACLAEYNCGVLYGRWIDASGDADEMREKISDILKASPCPNSEEWAIHDFEDFAGVSIGENPSLEKLAELVANLEEHGEAFALYVKNGAEWDDVSGFEDAYCGVYKDEEDYAYELVSDCYDLEEKMGNLSSYFDYASFARDLFISDNWGERDSRGSFHVFRNC